MTILTRTDPRATSTKTLRPHPRRRRGLAVRRPRRHRAARPERRRQDHAAADDRDRARPGLGRAAAARAGPGPAPSERIEIRRRLGYLPQSPGLYPGFTPFDLVDYVAVLKEHTDRDLAARRDPSGAGVGRAADVMHKKIRAPVRRHEAARRAGRAR